MLTDDKIDRIASALKEVTDIVREAIAEDVAEPPMGSVVTFERVWEGRTYLYAAVRSEPGWFLTGKAGGRSRTWGELQKFAGDTQIKAMVFSHTVRLKRGAADIRTRLVNAMPAEFKDWWNVR